MERYMPSLAFRGMTIVFKLRDLILPRSKVLQEAGIEPGDHVLDFGCGPGSYVAETSSRVGPTGQVYALDVHPLAISQVAQLSKDKGLTNVSVIHSDCRTGLKDSSVDIVLLHDTFHMLKNPQAVLTELHRVLKPSGALSFSDHHMREDAILEGVTGSALFDLETKSRRTYRFAKN